MDARKNTWEISDLLQERLMQESERDIFGPGVGAHGLGYLGVESGFGQGVERVQPGSQCMAHGLGL